MNAVALDIQKIRQDFPILHQEVHGYPLVYLDSAATSQKPKSVIEALSRYYLETNANVHRGIHTLSELATSQFEATRSHVAHFIGGVANEEVIYTRGTTESINLVAQAWGDLNIQTGDRIVITEMEHHANFVPWLRLAKRKNAEIVYIPITGDGLLDLAEAEKLITPNTKLVAFTHMSNVLGTINPVGALTELAHKQGALVMVDGAQSVPHLQVDVHELDVDFYAFSAHKMLGPTGVGILYGKQQHLEAMEPYQTGGEMIHMVSFTDVSWADLPWKFEAGTPNIGDVVAFKKCSRLSG